MIETSMEFTDILNTENIFIFAEFFMQRLLRSNNAKIMKKATFLVDIFAGK